MENFPSERRQIFSGWLRTGRLPVSNVTEGTEFKFNPWHDPANGQFTFAGTGRNSGGWTGGGFRGGGGGSVGGGGATGTWNEPDKGRAHSPNQHPTRRSLRAVVSKPSVPPSAALNPASATTIVAPKLRREVRNGYEFYIDPSGRNQRVTAALTLSSAQLRSRTAQAEAGGSDRQSTDDGGHYIAARFNGPTDTFNHFAQNGNFNRGSYRVLEKKWASALASDKPVLVQIDSLYVGESKRPEFINVRYSIDGKEEHTSFPNYHQGKAHVKR